MHGPTRTALAASALGLGILWTGPPAQAPALAQAADPRSVETTSAVAAQPADAPAGDPRVVEAPSADPAQAVEPPSGDPQTAETPSADAAQAADAPAGDPQALETPSADPTQAADAPAGGPQPIDRPSGTTAQLADWVTASGDNGGLPFVIVDKVAADVFAFDADGALLGAAPVLVGLTPGDDSTPGVGDRELSAIAPEDRTTPAGRFLAAFGGARGHRTVLWVDYSTAISLHPVVTAHPEERRLERLRSSDPEDRRITYGCINVPAAFYRDVVLKAFAGGSGVVYILPDTRPLAEVFPAFAVLHPASAVRNETRNDAPGGAAGDQDAQQAPSSDPEAAIPTAAPADAFDGQDPRQVAGSDPTAALPTAAPGGAFDGQDPQPAPESAPVRAAGADPASAP